MLTQDDWVYKSVQIRNLPMNRMVNISDAWKAEGKPSRYRPDKWFKSQGVQEQLEAIAAPFGDRVIRDESGRIIGIPGFLEVSKGGRDVQQQGTFVSYELAIGYFKDLSTELLGWFSGLIDTKQSEVPQDEPDDSLGFPTTVDDFDGNVRLTPDGRISVYDAIGYATGHKNPYQVWKDLIERIPVFLQKTEEYKFPGRGGKARPTPVADLQVFLEILVVLPGKLAAKVREDAVRSLIRVMKGDPTLVEEILTRIHNPQDLRNLEESIRMRRAKAYGDSGVPVGTLDNPITEITSDIKTGFDWVSKAEQMTDLLAQLATHRGMFILRESPHRPYSPTAKDKSRRIDLILQTMDDFQTLHIYQFETTYIDDTQVTQFWGKGYPEIAYRDFVKSGSAAKKIVAHLVAPAGITSAGVERLKEVQSTLDLKYGGRIKLDAMRLDELVWGEMYPAIEERYRDTQGKFGGLHLNDKIKKVCRKLCDPPKQRKLSGYSQAKLGLSASEQFGDQLTIFPLLNIV